MKVPLPPIDDCRKWILDACATRGGEFLVRLLVLKGFAGAENLAPARFIVLVEDAPDWGDSGTLCSVEARWHPASVTPLSAIKWTSYGPNMASTRIAKTAGYDDCVLVTKKNIVLEGPTFSVGWFHHGVFETPSLALGILNSVTRAVAIQEAKKLGMKVKEGEFPLSRMLDADEVMELSTTKDILPVTLVGKKKFTIGPLTLRLKEAFAAAILANPDPKLPDLTFDKKSKL